MRKSRFTEEQIVQMVRESDRTSVTEVAKKHGISEGTVYVWKRRFGGMGVSVAKMICVFYRGENMRAVAKRPLGPTPEATHVL